MPIIRHTLRPFIYPRKLKEYHTVQIGFSKIKSMGVLDEPLTLEAKVVLSNYPRTYP